MSMTKTFRAVAFAAFGLFAFAVTPAQATVVVQVQAGPNFWGSFSGSLQDTDTGAFDTLTWQDAGYGISANILFTDAFGTVTDVITTGGDIYTLYGFNSGNALIGTACVAGGSTACLVGTGSFQDLLPIITAFNGGNGICCNGPEVSTLFVLVNDADVPEPASLAILGSGLAAAGWMRRRKTA